MDTSSEAIGLTSFSLAIRRSRIALVIPHRYRCGIWV
nr:MAG TPA: hypothetical protein [Caudoviricetes sp.]